jgi:MFS family permease
MEKLDAKTRRKAISISIWEGLFANIHGTLAGGMFVTGFLITLGATYIHFAWLTALPTLASVTQILSAYWIQLIGKRKGFTVITAFLSRMLWIPIFIIPFFMTKDSVLFWFFVVYGFICVLGAVAGNAWTGWMADLVPSAIRGRYFSRRALILTISSALLVLFGGIFMEKCKVISIDSIPLWLKSIFPPSMNLSAAEYVMILGFSLIFVFAIINGIVSTILLTAQAEPPVMEMPKGNKIRLSMISDTLKHKPFVKLLIFMVVWNIVNGISVPFWTPYILQYLQMGYDTVGVLNMAACIARVLSLLFWGKIIDRFGAKPVLFAAIYIGSFHPLYYVVSTPSFTPLVYLDFISSGIIWSGVEIAMLKMLLGNVPDKGKEMYYAIYATITGLAASFPQFIAGAFADKVPSLGLFGVNLSSIQFIFVLVTIGRLGMLLMIKHLAEPAAKPFNDMLRSLGGQLKEIFLFNFIRFGKK